MRQKTFEDRLKKIDLNLSAKIQEIERKFADKIDSKRTVKGIETEEKKMKEKIDQWVSRFSAKKHDVMNKYYEIGEFKAPETYREPTRDEIRRRENISNFSNPEELTLLFKSLKKYIRLMESGTGVRVSSAGKYELFYELTDPMNYPTQFHHSEIMTFDQIKEYEPSIKALNNITILQMLYDKTKKKK